MNIVITSVRPGDSIVADQSAVLVDKVEPYTDAAMGPMVKVHGRITRGHAAGTVTTWTYSPAVRVDVRRPRGATA